MEDYVVTVSANPWQNHGLARDVNGDSYISPLDALLIINLLNFNPGISQQPLPVPPLPEFAPPPYYDVNGDGFVSPIDALLIINYLNGEGEGEGEAAGALLAAADGAGALVEIGLETGLSGGQLLVSSATSTVPAAPAIDAAGAQPETGYPDSGASSAEPPSTGPDRSAGCGPGGSARGSAGEAADWPADRRPRFRLRRLARDGGLRNCPAGVRRGVRYRHTAPPRTRRGAGGPCDTHAATIGPRPRAGGGRHAISLHPWSDELDQILGAEGATPD